MHTVATTNGCYDESIPRDLLYELLALKVLEKHVRSAGTNLKAFGRLTILPSNSFWMILLISLLRWGVSKDKVTRLDLVSF